MAKTVELEVKGVALDDVVQAAHSVMDGPTEEWGFRAMAVGERLEAELTQPDGLTEVSRSLIAIAEERGCTQILGASAVGERLAAAAVAIAHNGLSLFARGDPAESVLVVDGSLATGTQIARAARQAKQAGAHFTPAAVVISLGPTPSIPDTDELLVVYD
jgi:hypothetical protein